MHADAPTVTVLGIRVVSQTGAETLREIDGLLNSPESSLVAYVNAHSLNLACRIPGYRKVLREAALVLNDGSGLALAARLQRKPFPENLNGTDFNPRILELAARRGAPVFLLGGRPGVPEEAARNLAAAIPGLQVAGCQHGYYKPAAERAVLERIAGSGAKVLLVAMGNPRQELWLAKYLAESGATVGVAVGAFLDFAARRVPRAPKWLRNAGMEWVYRLAIEPRRLFRRYVLGNPLFLARVLRERLFGAR